MTNVEELNQPDITTAPSESPLEARRRKNRERKRAQRTRYKAAKAAESETLTQAWQRHSDKLEQDDPALYACLFQRHQDLDDLEMEISHCEDFVSGRTEIKPQIAECWSAAKKEFAKHGECNYGALDRFDGFHPSGPTYDTSEPYRWFGFRDRLSADCFFRITRAFLSYALKTKDETFDPAVVDAAVTEFTKQGFASREINPPLIRLIRIYRGLPENEPPMYEFLTASDGFQQLVPRSIAESYRNKSIVFLSPAQRGRLSEGRRDLA